MRMFGAQRYILPNRCGDGLGIVRRQRIAVGSDRVVLWQGNHLCGEIIGYGEMECCAAKVFSPLLAVGGNRVIDHGRHAFVCEKFLQFVPVGVMQLKRVLMKYMITVGSAVRSGYLRHAGKGGIIGV